MFRIICECGNEFDRSHICNPKTLRTWVCPRQQAAERAGRRIGDSGRLRSFNIDGHRTEVESIAQRFSRLRDIIANGWSSEAADARAQLRKEGTFHADP